MSSCRDEEYSSLRPLLHIVCISLRAAAATWLIGQSHNTCVPSLEEIVLLQQTQGVLPVWRDLVAQ